MDLTAIEVAGPDDPRIVTLDDAPMDAYLRAVPAGPPAAGAAETSPSPTPPMHGVGAATLVAAFERAGWPRPAIVAEQAAPDPDFPTVAFPNPEEPGAMDLPLALAADVGADVALANDPDADRLGVAIPTPDGGWRRLTGDELGGLLADHILRHTTGADRLVVTTLVSSSLLGRMAEAAGVHHAETFTGFKWIAKTIRDRPDQRFVFGYEQALGYLVAAAPRDKDGITAAVLMAEIAALARAEGVTLQDRLDDLTRRFGRHLTAERSLRMEPPVVAARVAALRAARPRSPVGPWTTWSSSRRPTSSAWCADGRDRGPAERHRAEGQGLRRGRRGGPHPPHRRPRRPPPEVASVAVAIPADRAGSAGPRSAPRVRDFANQDALERSTRGGRAAVRGVGETPGRLRREAGWSPSTVIRTVDRTPVPPSRPRRTPWCLNVSHPPASDTDGG